VIADDREIEGTAQLQAAKRLSLGAIGLDSDLLTACESIGIGWGETGVLHIRIQRERGVNMGITKVGIAERIELCATTKLLEVVRVGWLRPVVTAADVSADRDERQ
jgi:hypothetical protein